MSSYFFGWYQEGGVGHVIALKEVTEEFAAGTSRNACLYIAQASFCEALSAQSGI